MNTQELNEAIIGVRHSQRLNTRNTINTLLIMFIVCESMMNTILVSFLPLDNLLGYSMLVLGFLVISLQVIKLAYKIILIFMFCIISFVVSWIRGYLTDSIMYFVQFMSFGMVGIIGARISFDYIKIFKASIIVSELFIVLNLINKEMIESDFNFGYALIPGLLTSIFMIYNSWREKRHFSTIRYCVLALPICVMYILRSSRGNLVQLFAFILLGMFFLFGYKKLAMLITGLGIVIITNLRSIIYFLNDWANAHGLTISIIWKTYYLLTTEGQGLSHGRDELLEILRQNTSLATVLIGNGIGSFENVAGTYPHNIFLAAFSDFGIVGIVFIVVLLFKFFKKLRETHWLSSLYEKEFILLIFTLSFVKLCFSGIYWNSSTFWYMVSYLF